MPSQTGEVWRGTSPLEKALFEPLASLGSAQVL